MSDDVGADDRPGLPRGTHVQPSPALAVALLVLFVVCVALVLHSVGALPVGGVPSTSMVQTTTSTSNTTSTSIPKSQVIVQVANGTNQSGFARAFSNQLVADGWAPLVPIDGTTVSATIVYYKPGFKSAATKIDKDIGALASAVKPLGHATPCRDAKHDDVVVLLGANAVLGATS
jgi:hypothetical protein